MRRPRGAALTIGKAFCAILALAAATLACLPTTAGAAPSTIAPSGTIQGRPVHSGEGSPATARVAVPLRVAEPAVYARENDGLAQLTGASAPLPAAGVTLAAAVFGSLNAAGLSATEANTTTPPDTTGAIGPEHYLSLIHI